jgi:hypothetical protein
MGEESAGVNLIAEDESELEEDEDEEWWVGTVGVIEMQDEEEEALEEIDESEPEGKTQFITSICTRKDDSGLEDESEYPLDIHSSEELEGDRWWSPEPPQPSSEEVRKRFSTLCRYWASSPEGRSQSLEGQWVAQERMLQPQTSSGRRGHPTREVPSGRGRGRRRRGPETRSGSRPGRTPG